MIEFKYFKELTQGIFESTLDKISSWTRIKKVSVVYDSITAKFFRAPSLGTKKFERFFMSFNKQYTFATLCRNTALYKA